MATPADPARPALDLKDLAAFAALAETASMTVAARRLGRTQPAVSQALGRLEHGLGVTLVDRARRPLELTEPGRVLAARAQALLAAEAALVAEVREAAAAPVPRVRIGMVDSFAGTVGPALVQRLRDRASRVTVWAGISPSLIDDLLERRLDMIVATDPMPVADGLAVRRLLDDPFVLALPRAMVLRGDLRLEDLAHAHPFVRYSVRSHIGAHIEAHLERRRLVVPEWLEFDGSDNVLAMVAAGLGWAITTPLCLLHQRSHWPRLRVLPLPRPGFSRTLHLVHRTGELGRLPAETAQATVTILGDMLAADRDPVAAYARETLTVGGKG